MIHCSSHPKELPTTIGDNVVVESGCILHGCTLANGSLVGEGSQVMDGASLGEGAALLPGSLLPMGKTVPAGQLWGGSPATFQRQMTPNEIAAIASLAQENAELAVFHARETEKGWEEIEFDEFEWGEVFYRSPHWFQRKRNATLTTYDGPGAIAKTDCKPPSPSPPSSSDLPNLIPSHPIPSLLLSSSHREVLDNTSHSLTLIP